MPCSIFRLNLELFLDNSQPTMSLEEEMIRSEVISLMAEKDIVEFD
jgi:hypothetical protein